MLVETISFARQIARVSKSSEYTYIGGLRVAYGRTCVCALNRVFVQTNWADILNNENGHIDNNGGHMGSAPTKHQLKQGRYPLSTTIVEILYGLTPYTGKNRDYE